MMSGYKLFWTTIKRGKLFSYQFYLLFVYFEIIACLWHTH